MRKNDFVKWQLEGNDYTFSTIPAKNITLDAIWINVISKDDVVTEGDTKKVTVTEETAKLTKAAIDAMKDGANNVQIGLKEVSLNMGVDSLGKLAGSGDVAINAEKSVGLKNTSALAKLSEAKKKVAENAVIIDISVLTSGSTSNLGTVKFSVSYTLKDGQSADKISTYFVSDAGDFSSMKSSYDNGILTVETDHFSTFAICSESITDDGSDGKGGMSVGVIIGIVAAIIVVIGLAVFFIVKKKKQ